MKQNTKHKKLVIAWLNGATIQFKSKYRDPVGEYQDCDCNRPGWEESYEYRIRPEPRVMYCNEYKSGDYGSTYKIKSDAVVSARGNHRYVRTIKFVEVLDEG